MFRLLLTDELAEWFAGLSGPLAEDVATTLEVIAQLGSERPAPGSSEWLTWYEHPSLSERLRGHPPVFELSDAFRKVLDQWGAFQDYAKHALKHLESPQFAARLGRLDAHHAGAVARAMATIRKVTHARRLALWEFQRRHPTLGFRPLTKGEDAAVSRLADVTELREAYLSALAGAGFDVADVPLHSPALREIALRSRSPSLRLLYGIDAPRSRGLAILGEWMDRSFYGDSVRRAEAAWNVFLDGDERSTQQAKAR